MTRYSSCQHCSAILDLSNRVPQSTVTSYSHAVVVPLPYWHQWRWSWWYNWTVSLCDSAREPLDPFIAWRISSIDLFGWSFMLPVCTESHYIGVKCVSQAASAADTDCYYQCKRSDIYRNSCPVLTSESDFTSSQFRLWHSPNRIEIVPS